MAAQNILDSSIELIEESIMQQLSEIPDVVSITDFMSELSRYITKHDIPEDDPIVINLMDQVAIKIDSVFNGLNITNAYSTGLSRLDLISNVYDTMVIGLVDNMAIFIVSYIQSHEEEIMDMLKQGGSSYNNLAEAVVDRGELVCEKIMNLSHITLIDWLEYIRDHSMSSGSVLALLEATHMIDELDEEDAYVSMVSVISDESHSARENIIVKVINMVIEDYQNREQ